ncbi:MAG TPA: DUF2946 domain-containing protein [Stellaceae bacterium]|nr:DUF2946 domain-containing protein [Stellaceae bacterium]
MARRRQRRRIAGWLGLVALVIQAAIPLLLGVEITLAASPAWRGVFDPCLYGDVGDAADQSDHTPGQPGHHDHDCNGLCPICLALQACPVFALTFPPPLPVPKAEAQASLAVEHGRALHPVVRLSYRSRAPPVG